MPKFKTSSVTATCKLCGSQPKEALLSDPVAAHLCLLRSLGACLPHLITMLLLQDKERSSSCSSRIQRNGQKLSDLSPKKDRSFIFSHKNNMKQEIFARTDRFPIHFLPVFCRTTREAPVNAQRGTEKRTDGLFPRSDRRNSLMSYLTKKMKEFEGLEKSYQGRY